MDRRRRYLSLLALVPLVACEDEVVPNKAPEKPAEAAEQKPAASRKGAPAPEVKKGEEPPKVEFQEEDFVETPRSRDPFRTFDDLFAAENTVQASRTKPKVVLEEYAIDDLKLIGVITRIQPAKAMLVDPTGMGHVVHRNDLVGRAERVQAGAGAAEYEINWRVDRIRESDVVLVREDPSNPDVPSATRVVSMRSEE